MADSTSILNDAQLRTKALATLKRELGMAATLRFLAIISKHNRLCRSFSSDL